MTGLAGEFEEQSLDELTRVPVTEAPLTEVALPPLKRAVLAFGFLLVAEFFYSWSWYTVDILRPYIRDSLGLSLTEAGSGYSAQGLGALIGAIAIGQLADRFGRRVMLVTVMTGYGAGLLAGTIVASYGEYLAQRFVLGFFLGGIFPVVVGIYVGLFKATVRGRLASLINATASLAIVVQGLATGYLEHGHWHVLLWIGGVPPMLLASLTFLIIPRSADARTVHPSNGGRLPILQLFSPGLRTRTLMLASLTGLNFFAYQAFNGWLTTYLHDIRHMPPGDIGRLVAWISSANLVGGLLWGWAGDRFGRRFNALGFFLSAVMIVAFLNRIGGDGALGYIGIVYGLAFSSSVIWGPWITELYPPHLKSTSASIYNWGRLVSVFAPLITGQLAGIIGLGLTMGLGGMVFLLAGLLWLALPETHPNPLLRKKAAA